MADLLARSARFVDDGVYEGPRSVNPMSGRLSEVADGVALVEAFSHVIAFRTGEGLAVFDTSHPAFAGRILESLRSWTRDPVHTIVYTHGHLDHVGGAPAFLDEATDAGCTRPRVVAHVAVPPRFARYDRTDGYNAAINRRQFGGSGLGLGAGSREFGIDWVQPSTTYDGVLQLRVGDARFELRHDRGETDDHTWAWLPEQRTLVTGDLLLWVFPNAGNPQKVQRYPLEWAHALRTMAALDAELLLPAHGLPIAGRARIRRVLDDVAAALEYLTDETLRLMNAGATLDTIAHEVRVPPHLLERPYLRPVYDEPEFVVRNIWRLYGGWYDGNPARLKPAADAALAHELAALGGGAAALARRGADLADAGELRLACHLVELASDAAPDDVEVHRVRADVYRRRRDDELSLMAKGIFGAAAAASEAAAGTGEAADATPG